MRATWVALHFLPPAIKILGGIKMMLDGQSVAVDSSKIEITIKEGFHSAYKIFNYSKADSFGINFKVLNLAQANNLPILVNCNGKKYKIDPWKASEFVSSHNSIMKIKGVNLAVVSSRIAELV